MPAPRRAGATGEPVRGIQYHGWYDPAIPAADSIGYYEAVAAKMAGTPQTQSFYRLFMAPGVQHCGGGVGPNAVSGPFGLPAPTHDAAHDMVAALAHWVEDRVAPAQMSAQIPVPRRR
jgi:feruloyl esterase